VPKKTVLVNKKTAQCELCSWVKELKLVLPLIATSSLERMSRSKHGNRRVTLRIVRFSDERSLAFPD